MEVYPLISIISINYKQSAVTNQLLESLRHVTWPRFEVIIVDNDSGDDRNNIDLSDQNVTLVCSDENLGFAGGNNIGLAVAKGDFLLFLNNDTEVAPNFLHAMIDAFYITKGVGAVSPKIKYFYSPELIQYAGFTPMNPFTLRMNAIGSKQQDKGQCDIPHETPFAHGCAMMVKREVIEKVGAMPEVYFLYYEEHEWSVKIRKAGYTIMYQPQAVVMHKESVSVQKASTLKTYYINRNRILFMRRNLNFVQQLLASLYLIVFSIPKHIAQYLISRQFNHLQAYCDAVVWNVTHKTKSRWKR